RRIDVGVVDAVALEIHEHRPAGQARFPGVQRAVAVEVFPFDSGDDAAGRFADRHLGGVKVQGTRAVGVIARAVGVVGPAPVEDAGGEIHLVVIAEIETGVHDRRLSLPQADLHVGLEGEAAVFADRAPNFRGVVGGIGVPGVVPGHRDGAGGLVQGDGGVELTLAVTLRVVVHPDPVAPGRPVIVRVAYVDVGVGAARRGPVRVNQVHPAVVRAPAPVPGQVALGVDGAGRLGRDGGETADVRGRGDRVRLE